MKASPVHLVFGNDALSGHEQVVFASDEATGLKAIIAIHSTALGPAMGGTRMWTYDSEAAALKDVLNLARGMTYKNALADVGFGGGKAVILSDGESGKSPALLRAFGQHVERLAGCFITAEDVGISVADVEEMRKETRHVRGIAEGRIGDPSPHTAFGVYRGIAAALEHRLGISKLRGVSVCIQGLGHVGMALAELLHDEGVELLVADIRDDVVKDACERLGAKAIASQGAHAADCDVFAPCALGAVLSQRSIPEIRAGIVAGAANNQLERPGDGEFLRDCGILYAPDYVINAGGVISISHEGPDFELGFMRRDVVRIGETLSLIFRRAEREDSSTSSIADAMAEEKLRAASRHMAVC